MKIWTVEQKNLELDPVEVSDEFWASEYGDVAGSKGHDFDLMLKLFLAHKYGMVLVTAHGYAEVRVTVMHNWPVEWR